METIAVELKSLLHHQGEMYADKGLSDLIVKSFRDNTGKVIELYNAILRNNFSI